MLAAEPPANRRLISCIIISAIHHTGDPVCCVAAQKIFNRLVPMLPGEAAEHVVRAVLSFSGSCILDLFIEVHYKFIV